MKLKPLTPEGGQEEEVSAARSQAGVEGDGNVLTPEGRGHVPHRWGPAGCGEGGGGGERSASCGS